MATKLFLRHTQDAVNIGGVSGTGDGIVYDLLTVAGSGSDQSSDVNTTASGTEIQWTEVGGGSTMAFVTGRVPAGGFTLTLTDISVIALENNMSANCGGRYRLYKLSGGSLTELGGGPFDDGVEFATSATNMTWNGDPTDQAFAEDDRLLLRIFITNIGTMAGGFICSMKWNGNSAGVSDSFLNLNETVAFKAESTADTLQAQSVM